MFKDVHTDLSLESSALNVLNISGITDYLYLIPVDLVLEILEPKSDGYLPLAPVIIKELKVINIKIHLRSGVFTETMNIDANGEYYFQELSFDFAKSSANVANWLYKNTGVGFIVFFKDKNAATYLMGDVDTPIFFVENIFSGNPNKRSIKMAGNVRHHIYSIAGDFNDLKTASGTDGDLYLSLAKSSFTAEFNEEYFR